jgi:hypothetical protein
MLSNPVVVFRGAPFSTVAYPVSYTAACCKTYCTCYYLRREYANPK